jgi:predicted ATP-dependent endonuclease of OLD family
MIDEPIKYIQKVEIQGLFGRYDIEWNLHSDVNVLAGINGSGKTTILNCIFNLILTGLLPKENIDNAKTISLNFDNGGHLSYRFNSEFKLPSTDDLVYRIKEKDTQKVSASSTSNIYNTLDELQDSINLIFIRTFDTELKLFDIDIRQRSDRQVKTELDLRLFDLQKEYLNYQVNLGKKLKANKGNPDDNSTYFQDRFLEIVDELFLETNKKVNRDKNELEFLLGDKEINAYQLSSGEKQFLVILLTVLVQDNNPAILLMDEPEISLHMKWQRNLITYIRELNPNVQLIIATHSPDIIMDGWMDKVFNMCDIAKDSQ